MVVLPWAWLVAKPALLMVAAEPLFEAQAARLVRSCVLLSPKTPIALNCWLIPRGIAGFGGVTTMDCRMGAVTVSSVESLCPLKLAVIVVLLPCFNPLANPGATMPATVTSDELHVALAVISWLVPLKSPVAMNCCLSPLGIEGLTGVTVTDVRLAAGITVS